MDPYPIFEERVELINPQDVAGGFGDCAECYPKALRLAKTLIALEPVRPNLAGREGITQLISEKVVCRCIQL